MNPSFTSLVFVIGAAGGIGSALSSARGAKLVLAGRNAESLNTCDALASVAASSSRPASVAANAVTVC